MDNVTFEVFIPLYEGMEIRPGRWYENVFSFIRRNMFLITSVLLNVLWLMVVVFLMRHNYHYSLHWISALGIPLGLLLGVSIADAILR